MQDLRPTCTRSSLRSGTAFAVREPAAGTGTAVTVAKRCVKKEMRSSQIAFPFGAALKSPSPSSRAPPAVGRSSKLGWWRWSLEAACIVRLLARCRVPRSSRPAFAAARAFAASLLSLPLAGTGNIDDERRIEAIANGVKIVGRLADAVDTTSVSPLTSAGVPRRRRGSTAGVALAEARRAKERTYLLPIGAVWLFLALRSVMVGGNWSAEAATFIWLLARARGATRCMCCRFCRTLVFRSIVGWSRDADATWEETMRRMNARVSSALRQHPVPSWSSVHRANQHRFVMNLTAKNAWPLCAATWSPSSQHNFNSVPRRRPGRPPKRWDDELNKFVVSQFPGCSSWSDVAHLPRWPSTRHVQFDTASQIN